MLFVHSTLKRTVVFIAVIAMMLVTLAASPALAQDNVLGLPEPADARPPGALLLHGGGRVTDDAFDRFVELAGGKHARIVLVPSAGYRRVDYRTERELLIVLQRRFGSWAGLPSAGRAASFQFLYTDNEHDADDAAFVRPLTTATGVWFSGGAQSRLNYRYVGYFPQPTKFQLALRGVIERGGVVGGTSAGMAALPEIMTMYQNQESTGGPLSSVARHGLGLMNSAIVEQHFDGRNGRLERFTGLLRDDARLDKLAERRGAGAKMLGLAVEESTGLVVQADRLSVVGRGAAHVFVKSQRGSSLTWHTLDTKSPAMLRRDGHGEVSLVRDVR